MDRLLEASFVVLLDDEGWFWCTPAEFEESVPWATWRELISMQVVGADWCEETNDEYSYEDTYNHTWLRHRIAGRPARHVPRFGTQSLRRKYTRWPDQYTSPGE